MLRPVIIGMTLLLLVSSAASAADINQVYLDGVSLYQAGRYDAAEKRFRAALNINQKHVSSLFMMGETLSKDIRRLAEAEGWYRKALRDCGGERVHMPKFVFALGVLYIRMGRYEDAVSLFQTLVSKYPDYYDMPKAYNHLAVAYYHLDRYDEARDCLKTALQKDPGLLEATFNMKTLQGQLALLNTARYYQRMGDAESAVGQYNKAVEAYPNYVAAWYNLGMVYLARGQYREAAKHLSRAGALNPGYMGGREIPYELARAYTGRDEEGDLDEALRIYEKGLAYKDSLLLAGMICKGRGDDEKAERYLARATTEVEGRKSQAEAWYQLGTLYVSKGDTPEAVNCFLKALALMPEEERYRRPPVNAGQ